MKKITYLINCFAVAILLNGCALLPQTDSLKTLDANATNLKYQIGFSPKGQSLSIILSAINKAEKSILLAGYVFTSQPIAKALINAKKRGLEVRVIVDKKSNIKYKHSKIIILTKAGINIRVNGKYPIFHHKFFVVDEKSVSTGSFNYSANAAKRNAENVIYLVDVPQIAKTYINEWVRLWNESEVLSY